IEPIRVQDSIRYQGLALVRKQNPARLCSARTALEIACSVGRCFGLNLALAIEMLARAAFDPFSLQPLRSKQHSATSNQPRSCSIQAWTGGGACPSAVFIG